MIDLANEKYKKIGIFGLARTGIATYNALKYHAEKLVCYDDSEKNRKIFEKKFGNKNLASLESGRWLELDAIILSPGIPTCLPKPHRIVEIARKNRIKITSDIDLLYRAKQDTFFIAVTGTNGKSTTASILDRIFESQKDNWDLGGNIGNAVMNMDATAKGFILELSSYQIELLKEFRPNIALLLNISNDHLDRHGTIEEYIRVKRGLVENAEKSVINIDNPYTRKIYYDNLNKLDMCPFSCKEILDYGISIVDNILYDHIEEKKEYFLPENKHLIGSHNSENIAASFAAARIFGIKGEVIIKQITAFKGLPHRIQYLGRKKNIDFYNDSKATNIDATRKSVGSLKNIHLLAGGVKKEEGIESLQEFADNISHAYFFGEAKEDFASEADGWLNHGIYDTLEEAFNEALKNLETGNNNAVILLSPACASFDQFKDFEERGYRFIKLYDKL